MTWSCVSEEAVLYQILPLPIASVKNWKYFDNSNTRAGCEHFFMYWRWLPPTGENGNVQYPRMSGTGRSTWTCHQGLKYHPCGHTDGCKRGRREFAAICSNGLSEAWVTQSLRELGRKPLSTGSQAPMVRSGQGLPASTGGPRPHDGSAFRVLPVWTDGGFHRG